LAANNDIDKPRSAAELIDRVQIGWAALEHVVASLSETQLTTPGPGGWAIKDHLAHIGEWENALVAVLSRRPQSEAFRLDAATFAQVGENVDQINDLLYQRSRTLSISEVQANARAAHAELLAALDKLTDADVQNTLAGYGGEPTDDRLLLAKIAGNTYAHYAEHAGWINEQLGSRRHND
jgi:hypothetical protein